MTFGEDLGIRHAETAGDSATVELDAGDRHLNRAGTVHGGVIATLVDSSMGAAVAAGEDGGRAPVTIELKVSYLEPGRPGVLRSRAQVRKRGRRITIIEAEVTDEDGETVALATGTFTSVG